MTISSDSAILYSYSARVNRVTNNQDFTIAWLRNDTFVNKTSEDLVDFNSSRILSTIALPISEIENVKNNYFKCQVSIKPTFTAEHKYATTYPSVPVQESCATGWYPIDLTDSAYFMSDGCMLYNRSTNQR